jgi:ATP-dependent Clp protease ATP-binding subunit ClpC
MLHRLTHTARAALESAQSEARQLNQEFVGTEHLLLGVLDDAASEASRVLADSRIDASHMRRRVLAVLPKGRQEPMVSGPLPLSPKAQHVLNGAVSAADTGQADLVSTRLLLQALLDESGTAVADSFRGEGADLEHLRRVLAARPSHCES